MCRRCERPWACFKGKHFLFRLLLFISSPLDSISFFFYNFGILYNCVIAYECHSSSLASLSATQLGTHTIKGRCFQLILMSPLPSREIMLMLFGMQNHSKRQMLSRTALKRSSLEMCSRPSELACTPCFRARNSITGKSNGRVAMEAGEHRR